jgi:hypothetical protein
VRRLAGIIAIAVLTAACGVRPTGVISAGEPAVAAQTVPQTTVYLVRQRQLVPVRRVTFPGSPQAPVYALWEEGPTREESASGLVSPVRFLPSFDVTFDQGVLVVSYGDGTPASTLTYAQIVCSGMAQPGVRRIRVFRNGIELTQLQECAQFNQYMSGQGSPTA